jgi:hypothetical protein
MFQKRLKNSFLFWLLTFGFLAPCHAGQVLFGGFGWGEASSEREVSDSEGPFAMSFAIDNILSEEWTFGAEHQRSWNLLSSGSNISATGINLKYYWLGGTPHPWPLMEDLNSGELHSAGLQIYSGLYFGFGQSSLPLSTEGETPNTTALMAGFKAGVDFPLTQNIGVRTELNFFMGISYDLMLLSRILSLYTLN